MGDFTWLIVAPLVLVLLFCGCSSSYRIGARERQIEGNYLSFTRGNVQINEPVIGNTEIVLSNGETYDVREITVQSESTIFIDKNDVRHRLVTREIQSVHRTNRFGGALLGLVIGAASGGAVGFGIGSLLDDDEGEYAGFTKAVFSVLGVLAGGTSGLVVGIIHGNQDYYYFAGDSLHSIPR